LAAVTGLVVLTSDTLSQGSESGNRRAPLLRRTPDVASNGWDY